MEPSEYESLVGQLIEYLSRQDLVLAPTVQHLAKLKGKSGQVYEIDLCYRFRVAGADYLTLVECKYWNKRVAGI